MSFQPIIAPLANLLNDHIHDNDRRWVEPNPSLRLLEHELIGYHDVDSATGTRRVERAAQVALGCLSRRGAGVVRTVLTKHGWDAGVDGFPTLLLDPDSLRAAIASSLHQTTVFHLPSPPAMDMYAYLLHLRSCTSSWEALFIHTMVLVDRVGKTIRLTSRSVHMVFLTCLMVSYKLIIDSKKGGIKWFADIGGANPARLRAAELELLQILDFDVFVGKEEYLECLKLLMKPDVSIPDLPERTVCSRTQKDQEDPIVLPIIGY